MDCLQVYTRIDVKHTYIFAKQHRNKILLCIIVASVTNSKSNFDSKYAVYISYNYLHLLFAGVRITYIAKSNTKNALRGIQTSKIVPMISRRNFWILYRF